MEGDPPQPPSSRVSRGAMGLISHSHSSSHRPMPRGTSSSRQDRQRRAFFLITIVGVMVCIGGSLMQVQYVYFLFHSSNASSSNDGSGRGAEPVRVTRRTPLPPRMSEQDVRQQAFGALHKIPALIQDVKEDLKEDGPRHQVLYLITPTYKRVTQMVDMTRASQTLQLAQLKYDLQLYWIVVEDSPKCTQRIRQLLLDSGIPFAHLAVPTFKTVTGHKGVDQRNKALNIIRQRLHDTVRGRGIVYFFDDDNAYDVRIFPEWMRTKVVSVGAVGLPSPSNYERCHVNPLDGKVDRLLSGWSVQARRPFGIDMAGFAFSTSLLLADQKIAFDKDSEKGFLEHDFLKRLVNGNLDNLEPIGGNCTRILAWHVRTSVGTPDRLYKSPEIHGSGNSTLIMQLV